MKMKKLLTIIVAVVMIVSCVACLTACKKKTYEIAVVTDVGQLMDGGFNQGTYEGAKAYAEANKKTYQYYQPANVSDATDNTNKRFVKFFTPLGNSRNNLTCARLPVKLSFSAENAIGV